MTLQASVQDLVILPRPGLIATPCWRKDFYLQRADQRR
jgi:hypothetical protein